MKTKGNILSGIMMIFASLILGGMMMGCSSKREFGKDNKEIQGVVLSSNEQGMEIEKMMIETLEDGSIVGASGVGNPTEEIFFTESTNVVLKEMIRKEDGSVVTEEKKGSLSNIVNMSSVTANVKSDGGKYYATEIEIWINVN